MRKIKHLLLGLFILSFPAITFAQDTKQSGIGEVMRSNGRIYVVVAVMVTILAGLLLYLIRLDKKISKLEKE